MPERLLAIVHGEYVFDPVVSQAQRQWWYDMAMKFMITHCRFYHPCEKIA